MARRQVVLLALTLLAPAITATAAATPLSLEACFAKCETNGQCCLGLSSGCNRPSCFMGCIIAAWGKGATEATCNTTCAAAQKGGCSYTPPGANFTLAMCRESVSVSASNISGESAPVWPPRHHCFRGPSRPWAAPTNTTTRQPKATR